MFLQTLAGNNGVGFYLNTIFATASKSLLPFFIFEGDGSFQKLLQHILTKNHRANWLVLCRCFTYHWKYDISNFTGLSVHDCLFGSVAMILHEDKTFTDSSSYYGCTLNGCNWKKNPPNGQNGNHSVNYLRLVIQSIVKIIVMGSFNICSLLQLDHVYVCSLQDWHSTYRFDQTWTYNFYSMVPLSLSLYFIVGIMWFVQQFYMSYSLILFSGWAGTPLSEGAHQDFDIYWNPGNPFFLKDTFSTTPKKQLNVLYVIYSHHSFAITKEQNDILPLL